MLSEHVHRFKQFVLEDKWANDDQWAQYTPEPICGATEVRLETPSSEFIADAVTELVVPNQWINTKSDYPQENHGDITHCFLSVVRACQNIVVFNNANPNNEAIYAKSDKGK